MALVGVLSFFLTKKFRHFFRFLVRAPVSDDENDWVFTGTQDNRTCKLHTEIGGINYPAWSTSGTPGPFEAICCNFPHRM